MKIKDLKKEANLGSEKAVITVKIEVDKQYYGLDLFPDELIPDLLVAVGRKYIIKKGKLKEKFTGKITHEKIR